MPGPLFAPFLAKLGVNTVVEAVYVSVYCPITSMTGAPLVIIAWAFCGTREPSTACNAKTAERTVFRKWRVLGLGVLMRVGVRGSRGPVVRGSSAQCPRSTGSRCPYCSICSRRHENERVRVIVECLRVSDPQESDSHTKNRQPTWPRL